MKYKVMHRLPVNFDGISVFVHGKADEEVFWRSRMRNGLAKRRPWRLWRINNSNEELSIEM
jgi:hypothetical protein